MSVRKPTHVHLPLKAINGGDWGMLSYFGVAHEIVGEDVRKIDENYSFAGGHRVRLYRFKKNVHWRIPAGIDLDISAVDEPAAAPVRRGPVRQHHK